VQKKTEDGGLRIEDGGRRTEEEEERPRSEDGGFTSGPEDGVPRRRLSRRVWPDLALHQRSREDGGWKMEE
jgi:hypothetical protein